MAAAEPGGAAWDGEAAKRWRRRCGLVTGGAGVLESSGERRPVIEGFPVCGGGK